MNARDPIHDEGQLLRADIELLHPSPTNPRKSFPEAELLELAESIKQLGVMQPILVRPLSAEIKARLAPLADQAELEIIAGERRWRASRLAGLADVPVLLRHLDDRTVVCMQVVENLQREGLNAIDEAEGFGQLQEQGMGAQAIADKIGKSKAYVYAKLKLLALCPALRDALRRGALVEAIALLIARIPVEAMQLDALRVVTARDDYTSEPMSYRAAKAYIAQHYTKNLAKAAFDITDAVLAPYAGSCTDCPHRLGNQPDCEPANANVCTNPPCFELKRQAHNVRALNLPADTPRIDVPRANSAYPTNYTDYDAVGLRVLGNTNHHDPKRRTYSQWLADHGESAPLYIHTCPHSGDSRAVARIADLAAAADRIAAHQAEQLDQHRLDVATEQPAAPIPTPVAAARIIQERMAQEEAGTQAPEAAPAAPRATRREHSPLKVAYAQYRKELEGRIRANPPMLICGPLLCAIAQAVQNRASIIGTPTESQAVDILLNVAIEYAEEWDLGCNDLLEQLAQAVGVDHYELLEKHIPVPQGCARPNAHGVYPAQHTLQRTAGKSSIVINVAQTAEGYRATADIKHATGGTSGGITQHDTPYPTGQEAIAACAESTIEYIEAHRADHKKIDADNLVWWLRHLAEGLERGDGQAPVTSGHAARYQHPHNPALTWSGRGRKPQWVIEWIESGKPLADLEAHPEEAKT